METTVNKDDFFKKIVEDYFSFFKGPKQFLKEELEKFKPEQIDKKWIAFVFIMHTYYILMPSVLLSLNIVSLAFAFMGVGVFYYLSQVTLFNYQSNIGETDYEQKKLYVFAYAFALAELTGFILNVLILFFNLTHIFSFVSWLLGFFLMIPVLIIVISLKLSVFKVAQPDSFSLFTFVSYAIQALLETIKNKFGYNAWRELWADFNSQT